MGGSPVAPESIDFLPLPLVSSSAQRLATWSQFLIKCLTGHSVYFVTLRHCWWMEKQGETGDGEGRQWLAKTLYTQRSRNNAIKKASHCCALASRAHSTNASKVAVHRIQHDANNGRFVRDMCLCDQKYVGSRTEHVIKTSHPCPVQPGHPLSHRRRFVFVSTSAAGLKGEKTMQRLN